MRSSKDETWLNVAAEIAKQSTCLRRAVGCVLVNARGHVLATGYNGRAAGLPHCNEEGLAVHTVATGFPHPHACAGAAARSGSDLDGCEAIHAEQNALLQCRDVYEIKTCYVTVSPCVTCVKLLMNTSCSRIVFSQPYAHDELAQKLWVSSQSGATPRSWQQVDPGAALKPAYEP